MNHANRATTKHPDIQFSHVARSPRDLFVASDGWVVVHLASHGNDDLISLSPEGEETCRVEISNTDSPGEHQQEDSPGRWRFESSHVSVSTAGLIWTWGSISYFCTIDGETHFVLVTAWGTRLILALRKGTLLQGCDSVAAVYVAEENRRCAAYLRWAADQLAQNPSTEEPLHPEGYLLEGMLAVALRNGATETIPEMRRLNRSNITQSGIGSNALPRGYDTVIVPCRILTKLALRRFGELPEELPCYQFVEGKSGATLKLPDVVSDRENKLREISVPMNSLEVLATVGAPDYIHHFSEQQPNRLYRWGERWSYYSGTGTELFQFLITWVAGSHGQEVEEIESVPMIAAAVQERIADMILR